MGTQYDSLSDQHIKFIGQQHLFFSGSAGPEGKVNVSPKGMDSLRVLGPNRILWRNFTGSGNETAGHLAQNNRMTLMWCSFSKQPMILRAYGTARAIHPRDADWPELAANFPEELGMRQIYDMKIEMVQKSCGYAVPYFEHAGERDTLKHWAADKGSDSIPAYWAERNALTLDGAPTGIVEK
ncbi:pyridoxamine 5'-phosphate oxidase family protein [Roseovarius aestuarii]|uniref:Pyridoxamine 5'-phosphate oxidase n=1 Tax=Roseovarius aestuarii TaxID=475083 RepID=A0A1X7BMU7_9RHOB|nr:pyridoxamine 5'-phosphate oxidase family protein [Roseovarius aestuarii]SMC10854.1 Pyridoxamine 5'-phosphate oxidase [Roseovarius aestuarii]